MSRDGLGDEVRPHFPAQHPELQLSGDLCGALGGTRTPNLLIRGSFEVHRRAVSRCQCRRELVTRTRNVEDIWWLFVVQTTWGATPQYSGTHLVVCSRDEAIKEQVDSNGRIERRDRPAQVQPHSPDVRSDILGKGRK